MPIFEFECRDCALRFEKLVRASREVGEVVCPKCGSRVVDEQISTFASVGKGESQRSCTPGGG